MKLTIQLVPSTAFGQNIRTILTKKQWNYIRNFVYGKYYNLCSICGADDKGLEAHENWLYEKGTQKLTDIVAVCRACHQVHHFGLSELQGKRKQTLAHLIKINNLSKKEAEKYIEKSFQEWAERSKIKWKLDIKYLEENFKGILNDK